MEGRMAPGARQDLIAELTRSPHGDLASYLPMVRRFVDADPGFLAHAMVWGKRQGTIRDALGGMPLATLACRGYPAELRNNSLALLAYLNPRDLLHAWVAGKTFPLARWGKTRMLRMVHGYLRAREACPPWWERTALRFRQSLTALYALSMTKPGDDAQAILFSHTVSPAYPILERLKSLATHDAALIAGIIRQDRLPLLVCEGVLGKRIQEPAILAAVLDIMTPAELVKRRKALKRWGVQSLGATRGALAATIQRASKGRRDTLLTATVAAEALRDDDPVLAVELEHLQEDQFQAQPGIEGNWIIGGDRSPSMEKTIDKSRMLAGYLAKRVSGQILLIFFDQEPLVFDVSGKSYADIRRMTGHVTIGNGTSIGCVPAVALERQFRADGIALVSDGGERLPPYFVEKYQLYSHFLGKQPPVYLYRVAGRAYQVDGFGHVLSRNGVYFTQPEQDFLTPRCAAAGIPYQVFPVADDVDQYGLGALAETMRVRQYDLYQEIMGMPLLTLPQAFRPPKQMGHQDVARV